MSTGRLAVAATVLIVCLVAAAAARAQGAPQGPIGRTAAAAVPLPIIQSPSGQNPFLGGRRSGAATAEVVALTLPDAISRGLKQNLGLLRGEQNVQSAAGSRLIARGGLLPVVAGRLTPQREVINLEAFGFPVPPGTNPLIGPFNVFDARVAMSQTLFDWSAIQSARAGGAALDAARLSYKDARDTVVFTVATLYLQAIMGASQIEAAQAQVSTSQALYNRAVAMKSAGVVPAIEVLRAQVQLQAQQQRLIFLQNEFAKSKLSLARAIGLPLDQRFELADEVPYAALEPMSLEQALQQANQTRADLQAAVALVRAAEENKSAARAELLPSLRLNADVGAIGQTVESARRTYTVAANVRIPIFEGGAVKGRMLQADAVLQQQRAQLDDLRARVEFDVRSAFLDLKAADDRVQVARGAVDLANQQLLQAQDRFGAGVASNIEVVQAQEAVATASDNYISSLYAHNLAKISLARALGLAEAEGGRFLGGAK